MDARIKQSVDYLRSKGLANGNALGFHSGMMDDIADLIEELKRERDAAVEDLKNCMHFSNPKNNNVCNFCKKDMAEYPAKCKGWDNSCLCSPEWRGIVKGDGKDAEINKKR